MRKINVKILTEALKVSLERNFMNQSIQLKIKNLPKALAELSHSNQFLKMSAFCSYGICFLLIGLNVYQTAKPPVVFSFAPDASIYQNAEMPKPENEIKQAVKMYLDKRYKWEPKTVRQQLANAKAFISTSSMQNYEKATINVSKFAIEKLVSQKVYPDKISVDLSKKTIAITGDRITSIQGLRAAGNLRLELSFEYGPRTVFNPWGIYISKEKEEI